MLHKFKKHDNSDSWLRGPEYETMFSLGSDLLIDDPVTLVSCRFHEFVSDPSIYPRYVEAAVGRALSLEEFLKTGERIWNLEKLFNLGAGLSRADDCLPGRCYEPIKGEASEGAVMKRELFETMLDEYYAVRGWTKEGVPTREKLRELEIDEYAGLAAK